MARTKTEKYHVEFYSECSLNCEGSPDWNDVFSYVVEAQNEPDAFCKARDEHERKMALYHGYGCTCCCGIDDSRSKVEKYNDFLLREYGTFNEDEVLDIILRDPIFDDVC